MAFPTYKLGCDRRYIPMVSMINSTSCQSTLSSTSPWHTADRIDFLFSGNLLMLLVSSAQLPALSQISWFSAQNRALPRSSSTSNNSSCSRPSSRPLQSLSKASPGWALTGCILTRCERGPNEVRNQILGDWPPKSPDKLFGSHTLSHSFQNSKTQELSAVEQKRKLSQAAAAGKSKETEKETKGEQGRQRGDKGTQAWQTRRRWQIWAGTDCLRRRNRDSQRYLKAKTVWGESKGMGRGTTRHGAAGQDDLQYVGLSMFEPQTEAKHNSNTFFAY